MNDTRAARFWAKVEFTDSCWLWTGALAGGRYGEFAEGGRTLLAHRVAYEFCIGPIPGGLQIDHLCMVLRCVRPDHLEPVTGRINVRRWHAASATTLESRPHCKHGHEYTEENTLWKAGRLRRKPYRQCRACQVAAVDRFRERRNAGA